MKIALLGYGKMGKVIERIALERGHEIVLRKSSSNTYSGLEHADVAIDFSVPDAALANITQCLSTGIPIVSGTTGWLDDYPKMVSLCNEKNGSFIYGSNFSLGVNLFFELNKQLAQLMQPYNSYDVSMTEVHHTEKKDAPSGTAISLAEQILTNLGRKNKWVNAPSENSNELVIQSERIDPAPGTHIVKYSSEIDDIEIIHTAHTRIGFASGAVLAAEFAFEKKGIFTMKDVLGL